MKALKTNRIYKEQNTFLKISRSKEEFISELSSEELYRALLKKMDLNLDSSQLQNLNSKAIKQLIIQGINPVQKHSVSSESDHICISISQGLVLLRKTDILHCEADNSYCKIHMKNGKVHLVSKTLKAILAALNSNKFIRLHQSHAISLSAIEGLDRKDGLRVILVDGSEIPVSRSYKSALMERLNLV